MKKCPIVKDDCIEEACMWWTDDFKRCGFMHLVRRVASLQASIEELVEMKRVE